MQTEHAGQSGSSEPSANVSVTGGHPAGPDALPVRESAFHVHATARPTASAHLASECPDDPTFFDGRPDTPEESRRISDALAEHGRTAPETPQMSVPTAALDALNSALYDDGVTHADFVTAAMNVLAMARPLGKTKCAAKITAGLQAGRPCSRNARSGSAYCRMHEPERKPTDPHPVRLDMTAPIPTYVYDEDGDYLVFHRTEVPRA